MFRRSTIGDQPRDVGVWLCVRCGVNARSERTRRHLAAARTAAALRPPGQQLNPPHYHHREELGHD